MFWTILEEIAAREGNSFAKFITILRDEFLQFHGEVSNLASLLLCSCLLTSLPEPIDVVKSAVVVTALLG